MTADRETPTPLYHDTRRDRPLEAVSFLRCGQRLREIPPGESASSWTRLSVGLTPTGAIQVWCNRHEANVTIIATKPPADLDYGDGSRRITPGDCQNPDHEATQ